MNLTKFLLDFLTREKFFTEVLVVPGAPPKVRRQEQLIPILDRPVTPEESKAVLIYLREVAGKVGALDKRGIFTFAYRDIGRIRVIYGMQRSAYYLSLLKVPFDPPPVEEFFVNPLKFERVAEAIYHEKGKLYIVFGDDWYINATLINELFVYILKKGSKVITTIENPLAYLLKHYNGLAIQKELYEDIFTLKEGLEDIPLLAPDFTYIFDALNIYNLDFGEIFKYVPRSVNLFFNFPMKGKGFIREFLEGKGIESFILLETIRDPKTGRVDFNITRLG